MAEREDLNFLALKIRKNAALSDTILNFYAHLEKDVGKRRAEFQLGIT